MADITSDTVQHLARLSGLKLKKGEVDNLKQDISNIIEYIEQLSEIDTTDVEPTYQVTDLKNVWRDDSVVDYQVDRASLLALAPDSDKNQIKVLKVL